MKIGEIKVEKIPTGQGIECHNGYPSKAIAYFNGTPSCAECLHDEQQLKWNEDGNFFVNSDEERVYFEVVQRLS